MPGWLFFGLFVFGFWVGVMVRVGKIEERRKLKSWNGLFRKNIWCTTTGLVISAVTSLFSNYFHSLNCKWNVSVRSQNRGAPGTGLRQGNGGAGCCGVCCAQRGGPGQLPAGGPTDSKGLLSAVWYGCDTGATHGKLRAVFILKATAGSSMYNCSGKTLVLSGSSTSFVFLQNSIRFKF